MLDFTAASFAVAGLAAAAGPVVIHLWNRRRFRVVNWAAMDFLREALQKKRRIVQIRDLVLLALRVAAMILLGLALARPFFAAGTGGGAVVRGSSRGPVHAVLVVDNSRSMGVETAAGTLLDRAKSRINQFIDALPPDSRITLIPLAGSVEPFPQDAFRSKDDVRRALERLRLVDVAGSVAAALEQARDACESVTDVPAKRVAVVTDLQANAWSSIEWPPWAKELPELQIALVGQASRLPLLDHKTAEAANNIWIARFEVEDGIAGTESPSRFLAEVRAAGPDANSSVQATLLVDGVEVASQVIDVASGQTRELEFVHQFDVPGAPERPQWTTAELQLRADVSTADQLPADNRVTLLAPVVAALPIVFVDQWGEQENVAQGRIGETYALRHLLAPRLADELSPRRLIQAIHVRPEQVTPSLLQTARLVVVAGLEAPGEMVSVLREYVVQGGPLVLFAGGGFDPVAWQNAAWLDGAGILPAPLSSASVGALPQEAAALKPFFADFSTMQHEYFLVAGEDPQALGALFEVTPFFKAVLVDLSREALDAWKSKALTHADDDVKFLIEWDDVHRRGAPSDSVAQAEYQAAEQRARRLEPNWWAWRSPLPIWDRTATPAQLVDAQQPRVLAWFQGQRTPWVVERRAGAGKIVLFSSGVTSDWNLLRSSGAMYAFHRVCHQLLEDTLPRRNFAAGERIDWPLDAASDERHFVERPGGDRESLPLEALGPSVSGLIVRRPLDAGIYTVRTEPSPTPADRPTSDASVLWQLAVQAAPGESELDVLSANSLRQQDGASGVRILDVDEPLRLDGGLHRGRSLWKWAAGAMLTVLLAEMMLAAATTATREAAA